LCLYDNVKPLRGAFNDNFLKWDIVYKLSSNVPMIVIEVKKETCIVIWRDKDSILIRKEFYQKELTKTLPPIASLTTVQTD